MTDENVSGRARRGLLSTAARLLLHLAIVAAVGLGAYALAAVSLAVAHRGSWSGVAGWFAFVAVVAVGAVVARRLCCAGRVHRAT